MSFGGSYRYEEMKLAVSQFPCVKTEKPPVRRKRMQLIRANQDVYAES
jgi:hypothetical protein